MEQRIYSIENLCCANCAAKIEEKINALPEVEQAVIVFATKQLRLTAEDPDSLLEKIEKLARTVEPDVKFHPRHRHEHHHEGCNCGHHHHHEHEDCSCGHHHHHGHEDCGCGHHHHHGHEDCNCGHHHDHGHEGCSCGHHHDHGHEHHHEHGESANWEIPVGGGLFLLGILLEALRFPLPGKIAFAAAYLVLGRKILISAGKNLIRGHMLDENFLMGIATLGAFCIGEFAEAVGVMLFYRIGELFEEKAVARSRSQIMEAVDLRPETVTLADGRILPAGEARVGDLLLVRPGDRIPLDGVVVSGESRIDTAPITGEPVPVSVRPGSAVTSGCINTRGQLVIRAEKELSQSMVTRILNCVENAAASKPKIDRFITRFARIYTPIVVGLAAFVAIVPSLFTGNWNYWVYTALSFLVMSCPCALVLSVPLAFFSGIGAGSKKGILFKGGASMEAMGRVKAVAMDKTGTLTRGDFRVQKAAGDENLLILAASCEQHSSHPIALSIAEAAREQNLPLWKPESLEEIPGRGIRAVVNGKTVLCGNEKLMADNGIALPPMEGSGTRVIVAEEGTVTGYLLIADTLKDGAARSVARLHSRGFATAMLTGDNQETAGEIARATGIRGVYARLLPEQKLDVLREIRENHGPVMYVGDGINDAPVLAGADVGAAMGSGADAAIEAADVVFMTSDPEAIPQALDIAAATGRIAWQNVVFALIVKAIAMVLGLLGHASMWMAVFADSGVAMLCVLNSIRLLYRKK